MEAELQCIICLERLSCPVTFPCSSHSVCKEPCLQLLLKKVHTHSAPSTLSSSSIVDCPVCGKDYQLSITDFEKLQPNKSLARIIQLHNSGLFNTETTSSSPTSTTPTPSLYSADQKIKCEACDIPATIECIACGCLLCETHDQSIHSGGKLKQHPRFPIVLDKEVVSVSSSRLCTVHGKVKDLFCLQDNELLCCHCLVAEGSEHSSHECKSIDYAAVLLRARLDSNKFRIAASLQEQKDHVGDLNNIKSEIQTTRDALLQDVDNKFNGLIELLQKKKVALKEDVELFTRTKLGILGLEIETHEQQVATLESLLNLIAVPSEDPFDFVPRAIEVEESVKEVNHVPVTKPKINVDMFKQLRVDGFARAIDQLELVPLIRPSEQEEQRVVEAPKASDNTDLIPMNISHDSVGDKAVSAIPNPPANEVEAPVSSIAPIINIFKSLTGKATTNTTTTISTTSNSSTNSNVNSANTSNNNNNIFSFNKARPNNNNSTTSPFSFAAPASSSSNNNTNNTNNANNSNTNTNNNIANNNNGVYSKPRNPVWGPNPPYEPLSGSWPPHDGQQQPQHPIPQPPTITPPQPPTIQHTPAPYPYGSPYGYNPNNNNNNNNNHNYTNYTPHNNNNYPAFNYPNPNNNNNNHHPMSPFMPQYSPYQQQQTQQNLFTRVTQPTQQQQQQQQQSLPPPSPQYQFAAPSYF